MQAGEESSVIVPLAARGTVVRSLETLSSSGKCWHSDLARMCRKVDFPSAVFVVLSCEMEPMSQRWLHGRHLEMRSE